MRNITIDPVTRIEGHARVFVELDEQDQVSSAGLVVNELRGFERILVGMEADRMPLVTARICGVCPTAHHLAAARALDMAAGVEPPPAAHLLRELMYMGHLIHSHALSLFVLQGPDLVFGLDGDPATHNVVGVVAAAPEVGKKALRLRSLGQRINELVGGRGVHPVTAVAGGITFTLDGERRAQLSRWTTEALALVKELAPLAKGWLLALVEKHPEMTSRWAMPSAHMGTVKDGLLNLYAGTLRVMDPEGAILREFATPEYDRWLVEDAVEYSYMKSVRYRDAAGEKMYRVGPLARVNVADRTGTPLADEELKAFRAAAPRPCGITVFQTWARVIELIHVCEKARAMVDDDAITGETRVAAEFKGGRGAGHVEAPRGTLIHDYEVDDKGIVRAANLVVATQQNFSAINHSILQSARTHLQGRGDQGLLNAVEFAIRCYDPCLSCATHAVGRMPLDITVRRGGEVVRRVTRDP